jgi:hypothetical protein
LYEILPLTMATSADGLNIVFIHRV